MFHICFQRFCSARRKNPQLVLLNWVTFKFDMVWYVVCGKKSHEHVYIHFHLTNIQTFKHVFVVSTSQAIYEFEQADSAVAVC